MGTVPSIGHFSSIKGGIDLDLNNAAKIIFQPWKRYAAKIFTRARNKQPPTQKNVAGAILPIKRAFSRLVQSMVTSACNSSDRVDAAVIAAANLEP